MVPDASGPGTWWVPLVDMLVLWVPYLLLAVAVLVGGLIAALVARVLVRALVSRTGLEALAERAGVARGLYAVGLRSGLANLAGNAVAIAIGFATFAVLAQALGLPGLAVGMGVVVAYLPDLVAAAGLTLLAFIGADLASRLVQRIAMTRSDMVAPKLAGTLTYWSVLIVVLSMAVRQMGLETTLVESLLTTIIGVVVLAVAGSIAWGGRHIMEGTLKRFYVQRHLPVGARIRVGDVEGTLMEIDTLTVVIEADDGRVVLLPARRLVDETVEILVD